MKLNRDKAAAYLILLVVFLFALIPISRSYVFANFRTDIKENVEYCYSKKDSQERSNPKECQGLIYKTLDDPVALFTFGLFVFTMALAVFTYRLFRVTKDGIAEQGRLTIEAIAHAERSAMAAERSIRENNQSSERQLRAYVGFDEGGIAIEPSAPGFITIKARVTFKNFGNTPAKDIKMFFRITIDHIAKENEFQEIFGKSVLFPSVVHKCVFVEDFLINKPGKVFVSGVIKYADVFGERRETTFCLMGVTRDDTQNRMHLAACEEGNDFN